ncbi:MAG TPA: helix-turn-helix transcriptional regulator [Vineibacter sp.]|nr:helix-turn-helix transcriptional regulator [Vineibacter sp.]
MRERQEIPETLLDMIYDAAADDQLWPSIFREVASRTNSVGGVLLYQSQKARAVFFEHHFRSDDACIRALRERHVLNPWTNYMHAFRPVGVVVPSDAILPFADLQRTAFYDEVLHPQQLGHSAMIGLEKKTEAGVAFAMNRGPRQGPYGADELRLLGALTPHLRRSIKLGFQVGAYKALQRADHLALDRFAMGVILLDGQARILYVNEAARQLDREGDALRLRQTKVGHVAPLHARRLDDLVQSVLRGTPMAAIGVPRADDGYPLTILASSVRGQDVARFADAYAADAAVVLFIFDPASKAGVPATWLMDAYGLTHAEANVAIAASGHGSIAEAADDLRVSPNTIKTHLRHVFAKTGIGRQSELAALIAALGIVRGD